MRFPCTSSSNTNDGGWKQLEQYGIAIPRKWVDDADASDFDDTSFGYDKNDNAIIFVGQDVKGDGNCLFRCFAQSGLLPYDFEEIRQALLYTAQTTALDFGKLAFERCFDDRSYQDYLEHSLAVDGEWTGDFEMLLFLKTFGINVISFTMSPFGLLCFNTDQYVMEAMHLPSMKQQSSETIYLLHHAYGKPLQESDGADGNHFCLLLPAKGNLHPISGTFMNPSRAFHPTTRREPLQHDTNKFTGKGSPSNPLEEVNDCAETDNKPVAPVVKRKALPPDASCRCRDAKRIACCSRELSFPSQLSRETSRWWGESPFIRDTWFQPFDCVFDDSRTRRRLSCSDNNIYDNWFF